MRTSSALILLIGILTSVLAGGYDDEAKIRTALKPFERVTIIDSKINAERKRHYMKFDGEVFTHSTLEEGYVFFYNG